MDTLTPFIRHALPDRPGEAAAPQAAGSLASPPLGQQPEPVTPPSQPDNPDVQMPPPQVPHPSPACEPSCRVPVTDGTPIPSRQQNAAFFLAGKVPGVMASYAPGQPGAAIPTLESDETVRSLVEWREQAPYG